MPSPPGATSADAPIVANTAPLAPMRGLPPEATIPKTPPKRLVDTRRNHGKKYRPIRGKRKSAKSADALVRTYEQEAQRKKMFVKKAKLCELRLGFVVSAMKALLNNEDFVTLLRAENLASVPRSLAEEAGLEI